MNYKKKHFLFKYIMNNIFTFKTVKNLNKYCLFFALN